MVVRVIVVPTIVVRSMGVSVCSAMGVAGVRVAFVSVPVPGGAGADAPNEQAETDAEDECSRDPSQCVGKRSGIDSPGEADGHTTENEYGGCVRDRG